MSLQQPRLKTIKRLFAVSQNHCAFANCTRPLVDTSGVVVGEICHIKAQNANGPRYEATQTDEERHGFNNLVLMCGEHHKVIDELPVTQFTAQRLKELKAEHERGIPIAEPSDETARAFLVNSGFIGDVTQTATDDGINVAAGGDVIINKTGLSYSEVREIAQDIYRSNALDLAGVAQRVAEERVDAFTSSFLQRLRAEQPRPPETFADPDMQYALFAAQRHASRSTSKDLDEILVDLLVHRATCTEKELLQIVLNEAIDTSGRLTMAQIDALTIVFVLKYTRKLDVRTIEQAGMWLHEIIQPFLDNAARSQASFQHLQYAGCGSIEISSAQLARIIEQTYGFCIVDTLDLSEFESVVQAHPESIERLLATGNFRRLNEKQLALTPLLDLESEKLFAAVGLDQEAHRKYRELIQQKVGSLQVMERLRPHYVRLADLEEWWRTHPSTFQLTSVGIAVAHANLRRRGIGGFDLRTWIN